MILGAFVVIYSLIRLALSSRAGAESNVAIPWFGGKKIELKGPAWLLLVAIGVLMIASPLLTAFAQKSSDVTIPPITVQRVQENERLPDENYASFRFVSDLSMLDLRQSQKTPWYSYFRSFLNEDEKKKIKPAILRNVMVVRKVLPADEMVFSYSTSGTLVVRCLSHPANYKEKQVTQNGMTTDTWAITVDVSAMPMNSNFEIIVEATYYDSFSNPGSSYYSTYANRQDENEDLSVALTFPDDKPMKNMTVMEFPPNGGPGTIFGGSGRAYAEPKGLNYYWTTINTRSEYYYKLAWSW